MANRSYLRRSDFADIYPSQQNSGYDDIEDTVACGTCRLPLLWIPLFGISDLRTREVNSEDGGMLSVEAPIAGTEQALEQLDAALPLYVSTFPKLHTIESDANILREAIRAFRGRYLTIEWYDVETMDEPEEFRAIVRQQLRLIGDPTVEVSPLHRRLFEGWRPPRPQDRLRYELLIANSEVLYDLGHRTEPDLIGESWLKEWPSQGRPGAA
jgi:hypothetical protein